MLTSKNIFILALIISAIVFLVIIIIKLCKKYGRKTIINKSSVILNTGAIFLAHLSFYLYSNQADDAKDSFILSINGATVNLNMNEDKFYALIALIATLVLFLISCIRTFVKLRKSAFLIFPVQLAYSYVLSFFVPLFAIIGLLIISFRAVFSALGSSSGTTFDEYKDVQFYPDEINDLNGNSYRVEKGISGAYITDDRGVPHKITESIGGYEDEDHHIYYKG